MRAGPLWALVWGAGLLGLATPARAGDGSVIVDERSGASATPPVVVPREVLVAPGTSAREILNRQPGVGATSLGGPGALTQISIRGSSPDQVRVFLDGVGLELADGSPVDLSELPLWGAAWLELWRSFAPLARGGGLGGALELVTLGADTHLAEVSLGAGAFGTYEGRGAVSVGAGGARLLVAAEALTSDGDFSWQSDNGTLFDPTDDGPRVRRNADVARASALVSASMDLGSRCAAHALELWSGLDRGLPGPASAPSTSAAVSRVTNLLALRATCRRRGSWSVEGAAALRHAETRSHDAGAELYLAPSEAVRVSVAPSLSVTAGWRLGRAARLAAHLEGIHERFELTDRLAPEASASLSRTRGAAAIEGTVGWAAAALELTPRVRVEAHADGQGEAASAITWQAAAVWKGLAAEGLRAEAALGEGVRLPNLYELYGDGALVLPSPGLRPERAATASASVSWAPGFLPAGWLGAVEVSAFASEVRDLVQFRRNTLQTAIAENVERARLAGVEVAARADAFGHVRASVVHSALATESLSREPARTGKPLPLRPESRTALHLEGYLPADDGGELRAFVDLDRVGPNTYDPAALVRAPARSALSAGFGWRLASSGLVAAGGELDLGLSLRNLTGAEQVDVVGYPLPGRSWSLQVTWREVGL